MELKSVDYSLPRRENFQRARFEPCRLARGDVPQLIRRNGDWLAMARECSTLAVCALSLPSIPEELPRFAGLRGLIPQFSSLAISRAGRCRCRWRRLSQNRQREHGDEAAQEGS